MDAETELLLARSEHLLNKSRIFAQQATELGIRLHQCLRKSDVVIARSVQQLRAADEYISALLYIRLPID